MGRPLIPTQLIKQGEGGPEQEKMLTVYWLLQPYIQFGRSDDVILREHCG
jgi:hypothetical protein